MVGQSLLGEFIQPARLGVGFDLPIPHIHLKRLEPGGERLQFLGTQYEATDCSICSSLVMA
jgi:hypothetical protein